MSPPNPKLPAGAKMSKRPGDAPVIHAEMIGDGMILGIAHKPEFRGIAVQVQHPLQAGKPPADGDGLVGFGICVAPDHLMIMLDIRHPDGTGLAALMGMEEFEALGEVYTKTRDEARLIFEAGGKAQ